jgi:hypothetical protein
MRLDDRRRWASLALVGLAVAACSGSAPSQAQSSSVPAGQSSSMPSNPSTSPSPVPSRGPATAQFSIVGTAGLTGSVTARTITCNQPTLDGPEIIFLGRAGSSGPDIVIFARQGDVEVRVGTGSAATLRLRTFVGTGVTSFNAATGLVLDTTLTETTDTATATGSLGALSSISGSLDCGNEQPGSASIVISGPSPYGRLDGALTDVAVTCTVTASGTFVGIHGLGMAGTTPVLLFVTASAGLLQVAVETKTAGSFYTVKGAGVATLTPGGATITADAREAVPSGSTPSPNLLHVTGTATCGTTIQQ